MRPEGRPRPGRQRRCAGAAVAAVLVVAGCSSPGRAPAAQDTTRPGHSPVVRAAPSSRPDPTASFDVAPTRTSTRPSTPASSGTTSATTGGPAPQLPLGGRTILGHYRVVAYYGAAGAPALGVLGQGPADTEAGAVIRRAQGFAGYGLPVQPALELIATVAQGSPGPDGDYSAPVPRAVVQHYLAVAHAHRMLLILDLQPGRSSFLAQARTLQPVLLDPSVSLALDPEWKVTAHQRPGDGLIGSSGAADIDATASWLSSLVRSHNLPDKLLVVHEFTSSMLPDRDRITCAPGVEITFHADGFGTPASKIHVYAQLHFPARPFGRGFKLFLVHDRGLMSPAQVMALSPRPDVITYQ